MMRIEVAGAGAGKTTGMASRIIGCEVPAGKVVYCVAFTNAAADNIRSKLVELSGSMPNNIKVSTIHSFLYSELIKPYYHLLFHKYYQGISVVNLPSVYVYRNAKIRELEGQALLHQTVIPQRARWVVDKKTKESARVRALRDKVIALFAGYCHNIFVDEAQDIDKDMKAILLALGRAGVGIELFGDPKQDVKGHGCFRELIDACGDVTFIKECHRCPEIHLQLSNALAEDAEKQIADAHNRPGSISVYFESETDVAALVAERKYGLVYISRRNDRFETHASHGDDSRFEALFHEVSLATKDKPGATQCDLEVNRMTYHAARQMMAFVAEGGTPSAAIKRWIDQGLFDYEKRRYARMVSALKPTSPSSDRGIAVRSIEAVKGLDHERCLFILTQDLAPYLFGDKKEDNKTKHLLYVALTRSIDVLSILVTHEVEAEYSKERLLGLEKGQC